jgi:KDO2-lipid IV(A) lauroyltransferase
VAFGRSLLERGVLWWASAERIRRLVKIEGVERLEALRDKPLILLVLGVIVGSMAISMMMPLFDLTAAGGVK